jgi:hypothetical protein
MNPLRQIRDALRAWSEQVEVLPAVGGALEELLHPDAEEREEHAYTDERMYDTIYELSDEGEWWWQGVSRATPPLPRHELHLFRYFLDGSFRSYFLGTVLEGERNSSVHYAQVGACVLHRLDNGTVEKVHLESRHHLLVDRRSLSDTAWSRLESAAGGAVILEDLSEQVPFTRASGDVDTRVLADGKIRFRMRELEASLMERVFGNLSEEKWLIVDGSLMFAPVLQYLRAQYGEQIAPVLGVSKNFRKDPQFSFGRGVRADRFSIYSLLAQLPHEHRTPAFRAYEGEIVFWYVRLRAQGQVDYPLMGVVKCELMTPGGKPVPTELIDKLSRALVAERNVTPHGRDRRWHVHLYPIFLAEEAIRSTFYSREVVRQLMRWR